MKTFQKIIVLIFTCVLAVISHSSKAQCATIESNLGCQVDGTVDIYTYVTPPSGPCNSTVCNSYPFSLPANGILNLNCSGCAPTCNIVLNITDLNGTPFAVTLDFNTTSPAMVSGGPLACSSSGNTYYVYNPSTNTFKIYQ